VVEVNEGAAAHSLLDNSSRARLSPKMYYCPMCQILLTASIVVCVTLLVPSQSRGQSRPPAYVGPVLTDVSATSGLVIGHISSPSKQYLIDLESGGVGLFDCDEDGRLDVVVVNGSTIERFRQGGDPLVTLYHQKPNGTFEDITSSAGLRALGWGMGLAVSDFDNDGHLDLYVTGLGHNVLYRNNGRCRFSDVTLKAAVGAGGFSTGAAWADYDRDGYVDLFVSRYVQVDVNRLPKFGRDKTCTFRSIPVECGPWGRLGEGDLLFHNRGDGTFEEVSERAGVHDPEARYGLGVAWCDYDNDGWPDLFVANDASANYLYHNNHDGTFSDLAVPLSVAYGETGAAQGNMGVDCDDFNQDGFSDFFVTVFENQANSLYQNEGTSGFTDVGTSSGVGRPSIPFVGWGEGFADLDNDGFLRVANPRLVCQPL
jgi:hypothetical protein